MKDDTFNQSPSNQSPRVIFRIEDDFSDPNFKDHERILEKLDRNRWKRFYKKFGESIIEPALKFTDDDELEKLVSRATQTDPTYIPANFRSFYAIETERADSLDELSKELSQFAGIKAVDIEVVGPLPFVDPSDDVRFANQGYLGAAPDGINAPFAWAVPGGDGTGQSICDVEKGWTLDHEDLIDKSATLIHGTNDSASRSHGTAVLGEICAVDNNIGCVGIAPNVETVTVSSYFGSTGPDAILAAASSLGFGDVMLLEMQIAAQYTSSGLPTYGPVEVYDIYYEAIRLATALGIIVVEAGGNGTNNGGTPALDLDSYTKGGLQILNPTSSDFRDSGAIIVAASTSTAPHTRMSWSTFGTRVNCYSWGQNINTTSSNNSGSTTLYTSSFGGTSGASPIVTGAALCLQGIYEEQNGFRLSPLQMRDLLSDPNVNTNPSPLETSAMGVQPDLEGIITANQLGVLPDIYIRDFPGDLGEPHGGSISASPDIILRKTPVADPQASFGDGSGTEMMSNLGYEAEGGQDNFIYVRALNQGAVDANGAEATIFWSPPSTLVSPHLWNLVGTVSLPTIPTGEMLVCSDALTWPEADIPATGHYCFVGLLNHQQDQAPMPADFNTFDNYRAFIRNNNNVTWRNFNVVDLLPSVPNSVELPFVVAGWMNEELDMAVEMNFKMPQEAEILLDVPYRFIRETAGKFDVQDFDCKRQIASVRLPTRGRLRLGEGRFPKNAEYHMTLKVSLPKNASPKGEIIARQLYKGEEEVGRVAWAFQSQVIRKKVDALIQDK